MKNKSKNIGIIVVFFLLIYGLMLANIITPDREVSYSERRKLAKTPEFSNRKLLSGDLFESYEKYFLDQFVLRDNFREIKAFMTFTVFNQKDNNSIYLINNKIYKLEYPLNEKSIINGANKINEVNDKYLEGVNVSYAIIPDKNYFVAKENDYPSMDYDRLEELMKERLSSIQYINLFEVLDIDDYYNTDIHWRQEELVDVARLIMDKMGLGVNKDQTSYKENSLFPFYGSYYGQAAVRVKPDSLIYLTNSNIEEALVYDHIDKTYSEVYDKERFSTIDSYDLFLSGPKSILTISNSKSKSNRNLILFRDSFGSSIAPLMLEQYAKITLVDLRYMSTDLLDSYVDFSDYQDALFLYNTHILNNSYMLK